MESYPSKTNVMAITTNLSFIPQLDKVSLPNYTFPFELENGNYLLQKTHIQAAIIGGNLKGFVTGNLHEPTQFITKESSTVLKHLNSP